MRWATKASTIISTNAVMVNVCFRIVDPRILLRRQKRGFRLWLGTATQETWAVKHLHWRPLPVDCPRSNISSILLLSLFFML